MLTSELSGEKNAQQILHQFSRRFEASRRATWLGWHLPRADGIAIL